MLPAQGAVQEHDQAGLNLDQQTQVVPPAVGPLEHPCSSKRSATEGASAAYDARMHSNSVLLTSLRLRAVQPARRKLASSLGRLR